MISTRFKNFSDGELSELLNCMLVSSTGWAAVLSNEIELEQKMRLQGIAAYAEVEAYYFGCNKQAGHYFYTPGMDGVRERVPANLPQLWQIKYDGGLLPQQSKQIEGATSIHHLNGWTMIGFWDRSVDNRGNSNSAFFFDAEDLEFGTALALAKHLFPEVFARFNFEVKLSQYI